MSVPPLSPTHVFRRNLPHWRREGAVYWITFRLADALPQSKLAELRLEREAWLQQNPEPWTPTQARDHEARFGERLQEWLDAGYGSCALARPDVRDVVRSCLTRFDGDRLNLHAAVIMPNHIHALLEPKSDTGIPAGAFSPTGHPPETPSADPLSHLLKGIKGASARAANQVLCRSGPFWMDESYDRLVRSEEEYTRFVEYIGANPAKAGLAPTQYWLHLPTP